MSTPISPDTLAYARDPPPRILRPGAYAQVPTPSLRPGDHALALTLYSKESPIFSGPFLEAISAKCFPLLQ